MRQPYSIVAERFVFIAAAGDASKVLDTLSKLIFLRCEGVRAWLEPRLHEVRPRLARHRLGQHLRWKDWLRAS